MENMYTAFTIKLLQQTHEHVSEHIEEITQRLRLQLDSYLKELIRREEDIPPIGAIHFSFLYTSLYFGAPKLSLEAYGEKGYLEEPYYMRTIEADWLFCYWKEYVDTIKEEMAQNPDKVYREAKAMQIASTELYHLLYYIFTSFKYMMREWEDLESLQRLAKKEQFYISFGEYKDWQRPIYMMRPPIDLFNQTDKESLTFRQFKENYYKRKTFKAWKLMGSQFEKCKFQKSTFYQTNLSDVRFKDCIFEEVEWDGVILYGCTFENCLFKKVFFKKVLAGTDGLETSRIKEIFKNAEWVECIFEDVSFEESNLSFALMPGCNAKQLKVVESNVVDSDFKIYREEEAK